ncbi:MAG: glycosyltransferase family 2 protein, partial [Pseudomonadota bacterium]
SLPACEDYDLWLKLTSQAPVLYIDEPLLVKYGGHDDQLSRKYWGMDRFRVRSLINLLRHHPLTNEQQNQVTAMAQKKLRILHKGAVKHNNAMIIEFCNNTLAELSLTNNIEKNRDSENNPPVKHR